MCNWSSFDKYPRMKEKKGGADNLGKHIQSNMRIYSLLYHMRNPDTKCKHTNLWEATVHFRRSFFLRLFISYVWMGAHLCAFAGTCLNDFKSSFFVEIVLFVDVADQANPCTICVLGKCEPKIHVWKPYIYRNEWGRPPTSPPARAKKL